MFQSVQVQPELLNILKEEMIRLHELIKKDGNSAEKKWAMDELTKIHKSMYGFQVEDMPLLPLKEG